MIHRLQIKHVTTYQYAENVTLLPHKLLLRPREGHDIHIESNELAIYPAHRLQWQRDVYDNALAIVTFMEASSWISIDSRIILQHYDDQPLDFLVADYAVFYPFRYDPAEQADLGPYLSPIYGPDPQLSDWLRPIWQPGQVLETYVLLDKINRAIAEDFSYQQREQPGVQAPVLTLASRAGSCRDFATLFIEVCHYLGLAARFVSGYQYSASLMPGQGAIHAWSEVYLPGAGWKGFDSTAGTVVGNDHIAVAVSRHPESVPPVAGSFIANNPQFPRMQVDVQVSEIY
jgi:Transglutaminase-like enzymes, putative cysteine proteases